MSNTNTHVQVHAHTNRKHWWTHTILGYLSKFIGLKSLTEIFGYMPNKIWRQGNQLGTRSTNFNILDISIERETFWCIVLDTDLNNLTNKVSFPTRQFPSWF